MRQLFGSLVLATFVAFCLAGCRPALNGKEHAYICEHLNDGNIQLPAGATSLSITNSNISRIPADFLASVGNSLTELNITRSGVEEIEPNAFRMLSRLELLSLVGNKIRTLDASWFGNPSQLKAMFVWANRISSIDPRLYEALPNLELWDIAHNDLVECLRPEDLRKMKNLKKILISSNPWSYRCRPRMTWYLGSNHIRFIQDWGASDQTIVECETHEFGADRDDAILRRCVDRKIGIAGTLPYDVARLNERMLEIAGKVSKLEQEVEELKARS